MVKDELKEKDVEKYLKDEIKKIGGIAYKFVENKDSRMIVQETPDTSRNCKKEAALRDVEAKLYYLQALTPIPLVK